MPTYEYACDGCDHRWEEFQSIKAAPLDTCPVCGAKKARRLISAGGGIIFKGSGFYLTDYRSESYKSGQKADSAPSAPAEKSGDSSPKPASTESKPAPKAE